MRFITRNTSRKRSERVLPTGLAGADIELPCLARCTTKPAGYNERGPKRDTYQNWIAHDRQQHNRSHHIANQLVPAALSIPVSRRSSRLTWMFENPGCACQSVRLPGMRAAQRHHRPRNVPRTHFWALWFQLKSSGGILALRWCPSLTAHASMPCPCLKWHFCETRVSHDAVSMRPLPRASHGA